MSAGELTEYVDSGGVSLSFNSTTYKQLHNLKVYVTADTTRRINSDSSIEKFTDPRDMTLEADIWLTTPELATWVNFTDQTNNKPTAYTGVVTFTGDGGTPAAPTITGSFFLRDLTYIDPGMGYVNYHIVLESDDGTVTDG